MIRRTVAIGFALFVIVLSGIFAQEGNYRFETYGNQSVLLSGNVTGSAEDLGLAFYNPARLAFIEEPQIVIAGKAFQLINYDIEDIFESDIDIKESNFNGVPSIVSGTFKVKFLPNHQFAYSFLSRYRTDLNLNYNSGVQDGLFIGEPDEVVRSFVDIFFRDRIRDEWYGISWSHKLKDNFAIGASIFGSIYEGNGRADILISAEQDTGNVLSYVSRTNITQKTYGLFIKAGVAWQFKKVSLGLNLSAPFIAIKQRANLESEEFLSGLGIPDDFFRVIKLDDLDNKRKTTSSIAFGMGIPMGKSKLHLSADYNFPLKEYERLSLPDDLPEEFGVSQTSFLEEYKAVINFGAGADIRISPSVRLLVSFSSDYSATLDSPNLFDAVNQTEENINLFGDFWHYALGPDFEFKWGKITLGATYSRSNSKVETNPDIPDDIDQPLSLTTAIGFERWRFLLGLEIPLISQKVKGFKL